MVAIRFTGNYEDLSTDRGFQFKFYCEKCNNGYMSTFKTSTIGMLGSAARAASSLFDGFLGNELVRIINISQSFDDSC